MQPLLAAQKLSRVSCHTVSNATVREGTYSLIHEYQQSMLVSETCSPEACTIRPQCRALDPTFSNLIPQPKHLSCAQAARAARKLIIESRRAAVWEGVYRLASEYPARTACLLRSIQQGYKEMSTKVPCAQAALAARKLSIESRRTAFDAAVREGAYSLDEQAAAPKALGDLLEALAGAVFCDSGGDFERTWQVPSQEPSHGHAVVA